MALASGWEGAIVRAGVDPAFPFGSAHLRFAPIRRDDSSGWFLRADEACPKCDALPRRWLPTFFHIFERRRKARLRSGTTIGITSDGLLDMDIQVMRERPEKLSRIGTCRSGRGTRDSG